MTRHLEIRLPPIGSWAGQEYVSALRPYREVHVMDEPVFFTSTCPKCRHRRPQEGFVRHALKAALAKGYSIAAYCPTCGRLWSITAQERASLARELLAVRETVTPVRPNGGKTAAINGSAKPGLI